MNTYTSVRPEHLNHYGYLFGGQMLFWVDEFAWLTAARDFPGQNLVTRGMDKISFEESVPIGTILRFHILPVKQGRCSVRYQVDVYADEQGAYEEKIVFSNIVTFVSIDENRNKSPLPKMDKLRSVVEDFNQTARFPYGEGAVGEGAD